MANVKIIAAVAANGVIGNNGDLPWPRIPEDMRFFRETTTESVVIMGRKTFVSLKAALPRRCNIVVSKTLEEVPEDVRVADDLSKALEMAEIYCSVYGVDNIFIIGGGLLYQEALSPAFADKVDSVIITHIGKEFEGDVRFPDLDKSVWKEYSRYEFSSTTDNIPLKIVTYEK